MSKRKVFTKEELLRMAEYTNADSAATRKAVLAADGDAAQDAAIDRLQALKAQSAKITHNLSIEEAPPKTKPAAGGKRKRRSRAEIDAEKAAKASGTAGGGGAPQT